MLRLLSIILLIFIQVNFFTQQDIVKLSVTPKGGIFKDSVQVKIVGSGDIYYTLDGRTPSTYSKKYNKTTFHFNKSSVLRVIQVIEGKIQKEKTRSYIIGREFDMAVISIAGNPDDFFGFTNGIFSKGCCADSMPPFKGANFWKKWEKAINIEMFEPDGEIAFNQKAGTKIFGGYSRGMPMKSLAVHSRKKYDKKYFKHRIFPNKDIKKYKSFVLRNSGSDFNVTHFRDAMVTDLTVPLDIEIQAYRPVVVYINGEYWGLYNIREKINEHYLKGNFGVDPNNIDFIHHRKDVVHGNRRHYDKMLKFMKNNSMAKTKNIDSLSKLMDINNFINYNITQVYIDNGDAGGNIRFWRPRSDDGIWRWILFDTDISFGRLNWNAHKVNTLHKMTTNSNERWPNPSWSTFIIRKLLENDSIKNIYINRIADHLNTAFSSKNVLFKIDSIKSLIEYEMPYHLEKWKSNTMTKWERNISVIKKFATKRPPYLRKFTMLKFGIEDTANVQVFTNENGHVRLNSVIIKDTFNGMYFKGIPIEIEAKPKDDYMFYKWEGVNLNQNPAFVELTDSLKVQPIFHFKPRSKFSKKIVINEVGVNVDSINELYIEFYNHGNQIDLNNWVVKINQHRCKLVDTAQIQKSAYFVFNRKTNLLLKEDRPLELLIQLYDNKGFKVDSLFYAIPKSKTLEKLNHLVIERISSKQIADQKNLYFSDNPSPGKVNNITLIYQDNSEPFWSTWMIIFSIISLIISSGLIIYYIKRVR